MFEFIRQSHQAELTSARLSSATQETTDQIPLEDWCTTAIQSLRFEGALNGA